MKKWPLIVAAYALLLAGCAHLDKFDCRQCALEGFDPRAVRLPQPLFPNVFVTDSDRLVVDQEPIRIDKRDVRNGRVTVQWALAAGSPYTFPSNGIVIGPGSNKDQDKPVEVRCGEPAKFTQQKVFECSFRAVPGRSKYKYTVNVRQGDKRLEALDPYVETDI